MIFRPAQNETVKLLEAKQEPLRVEFLMSQPFSTPASKWLLPPPALPFSLRSLPGHWGTVFAGGIPSCEGRR